MNPAAHQLVSRTGSTAETRWGLGNLLAEAANFLVEREDAVDDPVGRSDSLTV